MAITDEERRMMIHALGLSMDRQIKRKKQAYRNHFFTSENGTDFTVWQSLVERGFAIVDTSCRPLGRFFKVTPEGMNQLGPDILKKIPREERETAPERSIVLRYADDLDIAAAIRREARTIANEIFLRDNFRCVYCGATEKLSLDHVHPVSRGGDNSIDNLVTACRSCNSSKGAKDKEEWQKRGQAVDN